MSDVNKGVTEAENGLADALCNLLAWPVATSVSARSVRRSVYTQRYQTNEALLYARATNSSHGIWGSRFCLH